MRIVIDPGHGGEDTGAIGEVRSGSGKIRLVEKDVNLTASGFLIAALENAGHEIITTRDDDTYVSLENRAQIENLALPDLFISVHCNGFHDPDANGFEVFTYHGESKSDEYATKIYNAVTKEFPEIKMRPGLEDGDPDKEANFYVLRNTKGWAVLLELGFITSPDDAERLANKIHLNDLMATIAASV